MKARRQIIARSSLIHMHDLRRRKAVKPGRGSVAVSADVLAVEQVAQFEVGGELLGHGNHVQRVAGRAEEQSCAGPRLNAFRW